MKRVRCPKCDNYITFDEKQYGEGQQLVYVCPECNLIPLEMGDNVFGRYIKGSTINKPIETVDPSIDTRHCIIRVQRNKKGELQYILRDAPSNTGTFYMNEILKDQDRIYLEDASIITIGATTLILRKANTEED